MNKLWNIERLVIAVWLLLLLALAPAKAQMVVNQGVVTPLSVEQKNLDSYQWHLYSDSTVNFAVVPADVSPAYAEFIGESNGPDVSVLWKIPGTYFFKVTAVDANNCAMNLKIGKIKVKDALPVLTAVAEAARCYNGNGSIAFTVTHAPPGDYVIKYQGGSFPVTLDEEGKGTVAAPAGQYNNLVIEVNSLSSYNPDHVVKVVVNQPSPLVIQETIIHNNLKTNTRGAIMLKVQGSISDYTYSWSNGATTKDIKDLESGVYVVTITDQRGCSQSFSYSLPAPNAPPVALNDEFSLGCPVITGNLIQNDWDPENDPLYIDTNPVVNTLHGKLKLNADGTFEYRPDVLFTGIDYFTYTLFDNNEYPGITATVSVTVYSDKDRDEVPDDNDPDVDGDGILNEREVMAGQDWRTTNTDGDEWPNYMDIDSDGDGIVDNIEAQESGKAYTPPVTYDANSNGINDAYDGIKLGNEIIPIDMDTDDDGIPDFLDLDSDNDGVPDKIEGHDANRDGKPDNSASGTEDADRDGLNDGYDTYPLECDAQDNILRSNAPMQDTDGDGMRDWRDDNDDGDKYPSIYEDLDGDGVFGNDDYDYDGVPDYLDFGRDCDLFIPNAFSPNEDGVHDLYQIYCINHYPNAKLYIFDQLGNKLFEKANYGNEDIWGRDGEAWWDGKPDRGRGKGEKVAPGTYYYVLDLGNGQVKKSFVFVSY